MRVTCSYCGTSIRVTVMVSWRMSPWGLVARTLMRLLPVCRVIVVEKMPRASTGMATPLTVSWASEAVRPQRRMRRSKTTELLSGWVMVRKNGSGGRKVMVREWLRRLPAASMATTSKVLTPGETGTVIWKRPPSPEATARPRMLTDAPMLVMPCTVTESCRTMLRSRGDCTSRKGRLVGVGAGVAVGAGVGVGVGVGTGVAVGAGVGVGVGVGTGVAVGAGVGVGVGVGTGVAVGAGVGVGTGVAVGAGVGVAATTTGGGVGGVGRVEPGRAVGVKQAVPTRTARASKSHKAAPFPRRSCVGRNLKP